MRFLPCSISWYSHWWLTWGCRDEIQGPEDREAVWSCRGGLSWVRGPWGSKQIMEAFYKATCYSRGGRDLGLANILNPRTSHIVKTAKIWLRFYFLFLLGLVTGGVDNAYCLTWVLIQKKNIRCGEEGRVKRTNTEGQIRWGFGEDSSQGRHDAGGETKGVGQRGLTWGQTPDLKLRHARAPAFGLITRRGL